MRLTENLGQTYRNKRIAFDYIAQYVSRSDRRELVGKRMTRVYYHLEPAGEERLRELIAEYETVTAGVFAIIKGEAEA